MWVCKDGISNSILRYTSSVTSRSKRQGWLPNLVEKSFARILGRIFMFGTNEFLNARRIGSYSLREARGADCLGKHTGLACLEQTEVEDRFMFYLLKCRKFSGISMVTSAFIGRLPERYYRNL